MECDLIFNQAANYGLMTPQKPCPGETRAYFYFLSSDIQQMELCFGSKKNTNQLPKGKYDL